MSRGCDESREETEEIINGVGDRPRLVRPRWHLKTIAPADPETNRPHPFDTISG